MLISNVFYLFGVNYTTVLFMLLSYRKAKVKHNEQKRGRKQRNLPCPEKFLVARLIRGGVISATVKVIIFKNNKQIT